MDDAELVSELQRAFPAFVVESYDPLGEGWMSRALRINGTHVARFAKSEAASSDLEKEAAVLPMVAEGVTLAVPQFELVGQRRDGLRFVVYPLLPGQPLEERLGPLRASTQERLATQLAGFISELQALPVPLLTAAGLPCSDLHADVEERRESWRHIEHRVPQGVFAHTLQRFDEYLSEPALRNTERGFIHADLSPNHWLFDAEREELTGIIDFGDCELGDPDYEYLYLLEDGGEELTRRVLELQGASSIDERLRKLRYLVTFDHTRRACSRARATASRNSQPRAWRRSKRKRKSSANPPDCLRALRARQSIPPW